MSKGFYKLFLLNLLLFLLISNPRSLLSYSLQQHPRRPIPRILCHKFPFKCFFQYALTQPLRLREALLYGSCNLDAALLGEGKEGDEKSLSIRYNKM
jgi:hypothetical protein